MPAGSRKYPQRPQTPAQKANNGEALGYLMILLILVIVGLALGYGISYVR